MPFFFKQRIYGLLPGREAAPETISIDHAVQGLDFLVNIIQLVRPRNPYHIKVAERRFEAVYNFLQKDEKALRAFKRALRVQFLKRNFVPALTQSGLLESRGFVQEVVKKLKYKLLPPLLEPENFLYVINHIFYRHKDHIWIQGIDKKYWIRLFDLLDIRYPDTNEYIRKELNEALHILKQRTVTLGLEREIIGSYIHTDYQAYSFYLLDQAVQAYLLQYDANKGSNTADAVAAIVAAIGNCRNTIAEVRTHRNQKETSLAQTYLITRIEQLLERLLLITDLLACDNCFHADRFVDYFIQVIVYEKKKNSIREFISANVSFLTYKITEHGGTRGRKYMTATRGEYMWMIRSSMGGGFIVSFTALIKNLLSKTEMAPFWQGFAYSVNYAAGFQLMHETHTTLATKQPAYTAAAIASSVNYFKSYEKEGLYLIAIIIARTSRTQLASFFGNLVVVFPLSFCLAALYHMATGHLLLAPEKAQATLEAQHPFLSLSIVYASFTGFFLFLSGLIGGYVENGINYGNIGERLKQNPFLRNTFSEKRLHKITGYIINNMGALAGNIALGFFLGMAGFIGNIFGIPFDIRHITIASGNAAMAFYTTGNAPGVSFLLTVFAGILLIGLFNFLVSFAFAFMVALRSRGVRLRNYPQLATVLSRHFFAYPLDFFFPPKTELRKNL